MTTKSLVILYTFQGVCATQQKVSIEYSFEIEYKLELGTGS